jgi:crotonobetainyl-CoA:carnitine CoA-transferase CaiB-like acyl-CoA transferase
LVGREDLIEAPQYADDISRGDNHPALNAVMSEWCSERTREQALEELRNARIPCGPVYSLEEVLEDPQIGARKLLEPLEMPGAQRPVPIDATPVRMSRTPGRTTGRAPTLGEHTDQILSELGYTSEQVAALRAAQVV